MATWPGCHRRAFEWFGAVPGRLIIDNPKPAITKACVHDPLVQRSYAECAEGYGFKINLCPPADPAKKGVAEAGVKFVKGNFLPLRSFRDLSDLNAQARRWVIEEAGRRIPGTTREQPLVRFAVEKPLLRACRRSRRISAPGPACACIAIVTSSSRARRPIVSSAEIAAGEQQIEACQCRNHAFLTPAGMSVSPSETGFITPIFPGSITPIRDSAEANDGATTTPQQHLKYCKGAGAKGVAL